MGIVEKILAYDYEIFRIINGFADKDFFWNQPLVFFATYYPTLLIPVAFPIIFYLKKNTLPTFAFFYQALLSIILAGAFKWLIMQFYFRPRPFVNTEILTLLDQFPGSSSFPSGHTLVAFAIVGSVYFFSKKLALILGIISLFGSVLRIFGGVHYPLDILFGIIDGLVSAWIIAIIFQKTTIDDTYFRTLFSTFQRTK